MSEINYCHLTGMFYLIRHTLRTLPLQIIIYLFHWKILYAVKILIQKMKKIYLDQYFANKHGKFWEEGILRFPRSPRKVIEQTGLYIVQ